MPETNLPESRKTSSSSVSPSEPEVLIAKSQKFSGPLPHPDTLRGYEQLVPGAAKCIIDSFQEESKHRRALERQESEVFAQWTKAQVRLQSRGQLCALGLSILGISAAVYLGIINQPVVGAVVGGVSLATIVAGFLRQRGLPDSAVSKKE